MQSFIKKERELKLLEKYSMPRTWEAKEEIEEESGETKESG